MILAAAFIADQAIAHDEGHAVKELIPTGKLRVGIALAPAPTTLFVTQDASGTPHGVTVDLGNELARKLGVAVEFFAAPNTGELTEATSSGKIDVTFMPVDEARKTKVDFGPAYYVLESTYLVRGNSEIKTLVDVDREGVRAVGIANTTTVRSAERSLKNIKIVSAQTIDEAMDMMRTEKADALALSRDALAILSAKLPGSRILDGGFQSTGIAIAVPKNRTAALAYVSAFMESAKASGIVRRAFDAVGLKNEPVVPAQ
jgi:polar amino acid transport system substrate-binding protein